MKRACRRACLAATLAAIALLVLAAQAQAYVSGDLIYAKRIGTSASPAGSRAVARGPDGVTVVAGCKWSPTLGAWVPMVAKYGASGERRWLRTYPDLGAGRASAVAVDRYGGIFVACTVGEGDYAGSGADVVVLRYGSAGAFKWARVYDGPASADDHARALLVDKAGDIVVVGRSMSTTYSWGIVVLKYDRAGGTLWAEPVRVDADPTDPDAVDVVPHDIARDADNNIYLGGERTYLYQSGGEGTYEGASEALMLKLATDGSVAWERVYDSAADPSSSFEQVAVRGSTVVGVGRTWPGASAALVVKYDLSGTQEYWREWGRSTTTGERYSDVVIDGSGYVYVTGSQWSDDWEKAVTMKLRPDLTTVWKATYLPTSERASGWYLVRNGLGNIYVAGGRWTAQRLCDIFTMKYGPAGVRKWLRVWSAGGPDHDEARGLVLGTDGGVHVAGECTNVADFPQGVLLKYKP
ncbi:MAG: hypothetical protein V2J16_06065 [Thermoleophilia bacterium]|jgi:hypothetical protein|nr:hypothetical protein [Thermoleophilia bacterium]